MLKWKKLNFNKYVKNTLHLFLMIYACCWSNFVCEICLLLINCICLASSSWSLFISIDRRYQSTSCNDGLFICFLILFLTRSPGRICRDVWSDKELNSLEGFVSVEKDKSSSLVSERMLSANLVYGDLVGLLVIVVDGEAPCGWVFSRTLVSERSLIGFVNSNRFLSELRISSLVYSRLKKENEDCNGLMNQTGRFYWS